VVNLDGTYTYTPNANFNGTDSFSFVANDGTVDSASAAVTVTVTAVNDAPLISGAPSTSVTQDTPYSFTPTASDVDGDALTFSINTTPSWATFNPGTGELSGTPTNSNIGTTSGIIIGVSDGPLSASLAAFDLTVTNSNDAPTATSANITTAEDTTSVGVTPSVTDPDVGDFHTFSIVSQASSGTASVVDNQLVYTPNANFHGNDSFTYRATDGGGLFVEGTASVSVTAVNDAPVANAASASTAEDTATSGSVSGSDVDLDTLTYSLSTPAANGTAVVNLDGTYTYTPNANFNGTDSFSFVANDGTVDSASAAVTVTVTEVNDAPVLTPIGNRSTEEVVALNFSATATDADGDTVTISATGLPADATFDGTNFSWTPTDLGQGTYAVTFTATDNGTPELSDSETITITVNDTYTDTDSDGYTTYPNADCDDSNASINPSATEVCGNSIDEDCNDSDLSCDLVDADGDGVIALGDCDDNDPARFPGNPEICDGIDNDCSEVIDDGLTFTDYYRDADNDAYGASADVSSTCDGSIPAGYVALPGDCNDNDSSIKPGVADAICDGVDDDCDGSIDEDFVSVGSSCGTGECASTGSTSCVGGLIVDSCTAGSPGTEVCGDGIDQDCNGSDLSCSTGSDNTPTGTDVVVAPVAEVALVFNEVTTEGETTAVPISTPIVSSTLRAVPSTAYEITTTANYSTSVEVCLTYREGDLINVENEAELGLLHYTGGSWHNITSSVDTAANQVCGLTDSFSPFVVVEPAAATPPPSTGTGVPVMNGWWLLLGALCGVGLLRRKAKQS
ncbi:MAG: Ig-like domain-containing protein, partial [Desulfuromonadales bacterium]|nr:Ig-like domain-containing protein [Desulfuromonadales bacterium]